MGGQDPRGPNTHKTEVTETRQVAVAEDRQVTHTQSEAQNPNTKTRLVGLNSKSRKLEVLCPTHMEAPAYRDQTRTQLILLRMLWGGYRLAECGLQNRDASSHSKESEGK